MRKRNESGECPISFSILFIFSVTYFRTLGTMFNLSVRGVNKGRLMIPHRIPIRLIFACLIKLREILVRVILAQI